MKLLDRDLLSIQEVRLLIKKANEAQLQLMEMSQRQIDEIAKAMSEAAIKSSRSLAELAVKETGFGLVEDKVLKNSFASSIVYESIKDLKTVGIINEDKTRRLLEVAVPMGVIAALIPSTNPTSTVIYKALISIKAGNAIIFSPHPNAKNCILEAVNVVKEAAIKAGCPEGALAALTMPTLQGTDELMKHKDIALILATGGTAMVKAAYSSGKPALGVGPGNGPAFIERSAEIPLSVKRIMDSKTFDNGTICASEQSVIVEKCIREKVLEEFKKQGGYLLPKEDAKKLEGFLLTCSGAMNAAIVGKSVEAIAQMASIKVPQGTRVLLAEENKVGKEYAYSREKLAPILAFYTEEDWESACKRCIEILQNEGAGHTMIIHSINEEVIKEFALKKPVFRLLVNTPGALGAIGATTSLTPSLTLGCGAIGGNATSDNVGPLNLINIRRVAYGIRELEALRQEKNPDIEEIVAKVMERLKKALEN